MLLGFGSVDSNGAVDTDCNGDGDVCFGVDGDGNINGRIDDGFDYDVVDTD